MTVFLQHNILPHHKEYLDKTHNRNYDLDIKNPTKQEEAHEYNSVELMELLHASFEKSNALLNQLKNAVK
jgi:type I restriction enzyme M protein